MWWLRGKKKKKTCLQLVEKKKQKRGDQVLPKKSLNESQVPRAGRNPKKGVCVAISRTAKTKKEGECIYKGKKKKSPSKGGGGAPQSLQ